MWRRYLSELAGDVLPGIASLFTGALISAEARQITGVPDYREGWGLILDDGNLDFDVAAGCLGVRADLLEPCVFL